MPGHTIGQSVMRKMVVLFFLLWSTTASAYDWKTEYLRGTRLEEGAIYQTFLSAVNTADRCVQFLKQERRDPDAFQLYCQEYVLYTNTIGYLQRQGGYRATAIRALRMFSDYDPSLDLLMKKSNIYSSMIRQYLKLTPQ